MRNTAGVATNSFQFAFSKISMFVEKYTTYFTMILDSKEPTKLINIVVTRSEYSTAANKENINLNSLSLNESQKAKRRKLMKMRQSREFQVTFIHMQSI